MEKIAFFINPLSYTVAKRGSVLQEMPGGKHATKYVLDDFSALPGHVKSCAKDGVNLVFIEGGDGTIQGVLTEILSQQSAFKKLPKIVLLAGGMTNLIAMQIGIKKPDLAKIKELASALSQASTMSVPLVQVEYSGSADHYYGFLFSTGAIATATRYTVDEVHTEGINGSAAVRTTLRRALFGGEQLRARILKTSPLGLRIGGDTIDGDHILSLTSTLPKSMLGFNLFWGQGSALLKTSYVKGGAANKVRNLARLIRKKQRNNARTKLARDGFHSWATDKFSMFHRGPIVLDGEFLPLTDKEIIVSATQPLSFIN